MANEEAIRALKALSSRWRYNWSDFDGRTLKSQINDVLAALDGSNPNFRAEMFMRNWSICTQCHAQVGDGLYQCRQTYNLGCGELIESDARPTKCPKCGRVEIDE